MKSNKVIFTNNQYYFIDSKYIYTLNPEGEKIKNISVGDNAIIIVIENGICVIDQNEITLYNYQFQYLASCSIEYLTYSAESLDNYLFVQESQGIHCYDISNNINEINLLSLLQDSTFTSYDMNFYGSEYKIANKNNMFIVYKENDNGFNIVSIICDNSSINFYRENISNFRQSDNELVSVTAPLNFSVFTMSSQKSYTFNLNNSYQCFNDKQQNIFDDNYLCVLQKVKKPYGVSDNLNLHESDCVMLINTKDKKCIYDRKTAKGERVLFADNNKVITYKNIKLIVYDITNWDVIESKECKLFKKNNSYFIENCNGKIFVFEGKEKH